MRGRVSKAAIGLMVISIGHLACPLPPPGEGITIIPFSPLNTLSCSWLDNFTVTGPYNSNVWSHTVVVIVPKGPLKITNISMAYLTGNCNHDPKPPKPDDEELLSVDLACRNVGAIGIIVYQIPNCPLVFEADPSQSNRTEDAVIAWTWKSYLEKDLYVSSPIACSACFSLLLASCSGVTHLLVLLPVLASTPPAHSIKLSLSIIVTVAVDCALRWPLHLLPLPRSRKMSMIVTGAVECVTQLASKVPAHSPMSSLSITFTVVMDYISPLASIPPTHFPESSLSIRHSGGEYCLSAGLNTFSPCPSVYLCPSLSLFGWILVVSPILSCALLLCFTYTMEMFAAILLFPCT